MAPSPSFSGSYVSSRRASTVMSSLVSRVIVMSVLPYQPSLDKVLRQLIYIPAAAFPAYANHVHEHRLLGILYPVHCAGPLSCSPYPPESGQPAPKWFSLLLRFLRYSIDAPYDSTAGAPINNCLQRLNGPPWPKILHS